MCGPLPFNDFINNLNEDAKGYYTIAFIQYMADMKLGGTNMY